MSNVLFALVAATTLVVAAFAQQTVPPNADSCKTVSPAEQEGPYYVANAPERSRLIPAGYNYATHNAQAWTGTVYVMGTNTKSTSSNGTNCCALEGIRVDVWHAGDYTTAGGADSWFDDPSGGAYSKADNMNFRGYQVTNQSGRVEFQSVYPFSYSGRPIVHVHVMLYNHSTSQHLITTQLYFTEDQLATSKLPVQKATTKDGASAWVMVLDGYQCGTVAGAPPTYIGGNNTSGGLALQLSLKMQLMIAVFFVALFM